MFNHQITIFDGAMGSILSSYTNESSELVNISNPKLIQKIHEEYIDAGANCITTNTFGANRYKLMSTKYSPKTIITAAINNAQAAAKKDTKIFFDIGPTGKLIEPLGTVTFDEAYGVFQEQIIIANTLGVDGIIIETMSTISEMRAAILAAKENSKLPVIALMTFDDKGYTLDGATPEIFCAISQGLSVNALGINCSLGPKKMIPLMKRISDISTLPLMVQPNAGLPNIENNNEYTVSDMSYANTVASLTDNGVSIFGGCCGTTPSTIRVLKETLKKRPIKHKQARLAFESMVCSTTNHLWLNDGPYCIGERLNISGNKTLKKELLKGHSEVVISEAIQQVEAGANILDINMHTPELNEEQLMLETIKTLQKIINVPLQIDSTTPSVIEKALRYYNGIAIINSINGKASSMESILPIAKKYGAVIIGLTLDDKLPKSTSDKMEVVDKLLNGLSYHQIDKHRLIVDPLTLTAASNQQSISSTLESLERIRNDFNLHTALGVSNISFGLPNRDGLNASFLSMALLKGLTFPIIDITNPAVKNSWLGSNVLLNNDNQCNNYIKHSKDIKDSRPSTTTDLSTAIKQGLKNLIEPLTKELLQQQEPLEIISNILVPTLDSIGEQFEKNEIFLPQLIQSAEMANKAFLIVSHSIKNQSDQLTKHKIILATVEGDIHDIGKNLVKVLLKSYGYYVIDLGKNVPKEKILQAIETHDVKLVGLSALMTSTVENMAKTIDYIKSNTSKPRIFVGGAVLTPEYAKKIQADYYCKDAQASVAVANNFF